MPSAHEAPAPDARGDRPFVRESDFVGPLCPTGQLWADRALREDARDAQWEPVDTVIRRREARIGELYRTAALLTLSGDLAGAGAVGIRAVAESRALTEFLTTSPAYCLDCFLLGIRCGRHADRYYDPVPGGGMPGSTVPGGGGPGGGARARTTGYGVERDAGRAHLPQWRRFGADEFPSAGG